MVVANNRAHTALPRERAYGRLGGLFRLTSGGVMQSASTERIVRARSFDRGHSNSSPSLQPGIVIATRPGGLDGVRSASSRICKTHTQQGITCHNTMTLEKWGESLKNCVEKQEGKSDKTPKRYVAMDAHTAIHLRASNKSDAPKNKPACADESDGDMSAS